MNKTDLRIKAKYARNLFVEKQFSCNIPLPDWLVSKAQASVCVAGYVSNGKEPDILPWLAVIADAGSETALPYIANRTEPMSFRHWQVDAPLHSAPFSFVQPDGAATLATPDMILTPMVAFDLAGNRLGQGAGHYDRAFEALPHALRIGIAWSVQCLPDLPADPWDVPLDAVVTERETLLMPNSRLHGEEIG